MNIKLILIGLLLVLFSTPIFALSDANLVAYYKFDETTGTTAIDWKGFDQNGTNTNVVLGEIGKIGYGYNYTTGPSSVTDLGSEIPFDVDRFALGVWIKTNISSTRHPVAGHNLMANGGNNRDGWGLWIGVDFPGKAQFQINTSANISGITNVYSDGNVADGLWHFIVIDYNGTHARMFVDGNQQGGNVLSAPPRDVSGQKTSIGNIYYQGSYEEYFRGVIDEVSFWNKSLTQTEINELYNSGNGLTYPFYSVSFTYNINKSEAKIYLTDTSNFPVITDWNWLVDGLSISTDQNTSFSVVSNTDYNICLIINTGDYSHCSTINSGELFGRGFLKLYDSANNELDGVGYSINPALNGVSSGVLTDNNLDLNLQAITSQNYTFTFTKPDYTTLSFVLPLTQYTDFNYSFVLIDSNKSTNVNFQVFNESGAYANTKTFFAYDYSLNKYVGIQTTDTLGRLSFNLDQTKSDYNFFSTDFNFGTTVWNINKPKDALTLLDINGNWDYSITGASYSSASNIVAGIQKLLLQNTVYPYTIKITDTNKNYIPTTFGLKSITSETTKTLTPYLYKRSDADLKLIKLIDFSTNQPHSNPEELKLSLYNDTNGLIPIGVFVNDSTGTYNIFMDKNATYELQVLSQSYTLRPTLDIYYLYLTQDISILIDNNLLVDANVPVMDSNLPIIFMQVREATFGCTMDQENCYPSMIFSLIAISLLLIVLAISGQVGAISQSVSTGILLTIFLIIGFIPLWLFGVGVVILIAWGVFGQ